MQNEPPIAWRSVAADPPDADVRVVVLNERNETAVAYRTDHNGGGWVSWAPGFSSPSHWLPIPPLPSVEPVEDRSERTRQTIAKYSAIVDALNCAKCWEPDARILGNCRAGDLKLALEECRELIERDEPLMPIYAAESVRFWCCPNGCRSGVSWDSDGVASCDDCFADSLGFNPNEVGPEPEPEPPDEELPDGRPCARPGCGTVIVGDWSFAWCEECCETGVCQHDNRPHECDECAIESDLAFDARREGLQ